MSRSARRMDARATPREFKPECAVDTPSYKQKQREISSGAPKELVRSSGFEPPRYCYRQPLKLVRLPVPPRPHRAGTLLILSAGDFLCQTAVVLWFSSHCGRRHCRQQQKKQGIRRDVQIEVEQAMEQ